MLYEFHQAHQSYIATLSCVYKACLESGLTERLAEEYVLMVMAQVRDIVRDEVTT